MRLGSFVDGSVRRLFLQAGNTAIDLLAADERDEFRSMLSFIEGGEAAEEIATEIARNPPARSVRGMDELRIAAPLLPSTVLCAGSNYRAHNAEKAGSPLSGREPEFFLKTSDCVIGPGEDIVHDPRLTRKLDCETELAVVVGRPGRHIPVDDALSHVFGYTIANDVTARDRQVRRTPEGVVFYELGRGKAFDTSLPLGPVIATTSEIPDPQTLMLRTTVNGELRQQANTADMIWSCAELIHFFSTNFTLKPGMVILTGTPAGTAWSVDRELGGTWTPTEGLIAATRYCLPGDTVISEIENVGALQNAVVERA
ncbi:fumarylacetoacetate hydrolase family protein [Oricola cellulosilytica]|uniref:FAA hydrolase family protein n=1 Tax=Oricola cellulosilytica TaxID=1429082 RepID=A0A4R0PBM8_9HYPH|nr:fumarylacetoacetate hydrolase family protein [Oricola cellulosilytica]TCD13822.1 FAA hydrolase family protein [Oricola cellulosilytica]